MEKRNIQIDLKTARKWYNGNNETLKDLALQAFNMNELEEPKLPSSWEEYNKIMPEYFYIKEFNKYDTYLLLKLLILRDVYRQGWKPRWTGDKSEFCIYYNSHHKNILTDLFYLDSHIFSFPTKELANQFLENFRKELEQLKELL